MLAALQQSMLIANARATPNNIAYEKTKWAFINAFTQARIDLNTKQAPRNSLNRLWQRMFVPEALKPKEGVPDYVKEVQEWHVPQPPTMTQRLASGAANLYYTMMTPVIEVVRRVAPFSFGFVEFPQFEIKAENAEIVQQETAEPLSKALTRNDCIRKALIELEADLKKEKRLLRFLGFEPDEFDLRAVLKDLSIVLSSLNERDLGYAGIFESLNFCVTVAADTNDVATLRHEFLHALHFEAIRQALKPQHLANMPVAFCEEIVQSWPDDFVAKERVTEFIEKYKSKPETFAHSDDLPEEIKYVAALLFWNGSQDAAHKETIASIFDTVTFNRAYLIDKLKARSYLENNMLFWSLGFGAFDVYDEHSGFKPEFCPASQFGYCNEFMYHELLDSDLLDALAFPGLTGTGGGS